ncbi:MAG: hypothetical protein KGM96_11615 [Acidobacteriota bacterium]|nr:hypothetical protein [Acidobacteriota bacterium]
MNTVEKFRKLPLAERKAIVVSFAALEDSDDRLTVEYILTHDKVGVETRRTAARYSRLGHFRKSGIEGFT